MNELGQPDYRLQENQRKWLSHLATKYYDWLGDTRYNRLVFRVLNDGGYEEADRYHFDELRELYIEKINKDSKIAKEELLY